MIICGAYNCALEEFVARWRAEGSIWNSNVLQALIDKANTRMRDKERLKDVREHQQYPVAPEAVETMVLFWAIMALSEIYKCQHSVYGEDAVNAQQEPTPLIERTERRTVDSSLQWVKLIAAQHECAIEQRQPPIIKQRLNVFSVRNPERSGVPLKIYSTADQQVQVATQNTLQYVQESVFARRSAAVLKGAEMHTPPEFVRPLGTAAESAQVRHEDFDHAVRRRRFEQVGEARTAPIGGCTVNIRDNVIAVDERVNKPPRL